MKSIRSLAAVLLTTLAFGFSPTTASSAEIIIGLDTEFSGATAPEGTAPWVTLKFEDLAGGGVRLTISNSGLVGTEFVSELYFNFNPDKDAALFVPTATGTGSQTFYNSILAGNNLYKADGDGFFDFNINFPPPPGDFGSKFTAGETFILEWSAATNLTVADFMFPSVGGPVAQTGFFGAAHVQGIGSNGQGSGWIGNGRQDIPVPEPGGLALLGLALAGLAAVRRRRG